jgi:hypothetical protein
MTSILNPTVKSIEQDKRESPDSGDQSIFSRQTPKEYYELRQLGQPEGNNPKLPNNKEALLQGQAVKPSNPQEGTAMENLEGDPKKASNQEQGRPIASNDGRDIGTYTLTPVDQEPSTNNRDRDDSRYDGDRCPLNLAQLPNFSLSSIEQFKPWRSHPAIIEINAENAKHPQTRELLSKNPVKIDSKVSKLVLNSGNYIDPDFNPCVYSILDDISNLEFMRERRMEWRRLKYAFRGHKSWMSQQPADPVTLESKFSYNSNVRCLLETLIRSKIDLNKYVSAGNNSTGEYEILLFNDEGKSLKVKIDDFVPVIEESGTYHISYVRPVVRENEVFVLPCLLEKALAKVFGGYITLSKAPLSSLIPTVLGKLKIERWNSHQFDSEKLDTGTEEMLFAIKENGNDKRAGFCSYYNIQVKDESRVTVFTGLEDLEKTVRQSDGTSTAKKADIKSMFSGLLRISGENKSEQRESFEFEGKRVAVNIKAKSQGTMRIVLRASNTRSDSASSSLSHLLLLGVPIKIIRHEADLIDKLGTITHSFEQGEAFVVLAKFDTAACFLDISYKGGLEIRPIEAEDVARVNKDLVRKSAFAEGIEMLKDINVVSVEQTRSRFFKVLNPQGLAGQELKVEGLEERSHFYIEHNGVTGRSTDDIRAMRLNGQEEEYLSFFAKHPGAKPDLINIYY